MSNPRSDDPTSAIAAEHVLRLLSGADEQEALRRVANDPEFAEEAARWRAEFAYLAASVEPITPPFRVWEQISAGLGSGRAANDNIALLRRQLARWRAVGAAMTAVAAALAVVLVSRPPTPVSTPAPQVATVAGPPMVALLGGEGSTKVVASWDPKARQLVLGEAAPLGGDPSHSHELWVIPSDGKPRSLGTIAAGRQSHKEVADAIARLLSQGATIAISVEPRGGSPTGAPTGPVIASGPLNRA